jgi:hypothetical protein
MKGKTFLIVAALSFAALLAAACSAGSNTPTIAGNTAPGNTATTTNGASPAAAKTDEEVPASVKSAFPDAQSFTKQHKDLTKEQIASIEKDSGGKVPDTDHHSYLAFSTSGGARKQIGAATVVKAGAKNVVIVYDNKDGSPVIKELRTDGVPAPFLAQFAGKGHDNSLLLGEDIKAIGAKEDEAKTITEAVRVDVLTMQALYGAAHKH